MSQAASFATHRPLYWDQIAAHAAHDFLAFAAFVYGYKPNEHHLVMAERFLYGGSYEIFLGYPDCAKSSWALAWAAWTLGRNPNFRWLIASESSTGVAVANVTTLGDVIATNERYQMVFGMLQDPTHHSTWSTQAIELRTYLTAEAANRLRQPSTPPPPPSLLEPEPHKPPGAIPIWPQRGRRPNLRFPNAQAVGWRSGYTGIRIDGIIADDIVSLRTSSSEAMTQAVFDTFHNRMLSRFESGLGDSPPWARVFVLGQRWMPRDFYGMLEASGYSCYDNNPMNEGLEVLGEAYTKDARVQ